MKIALTDNAVVGRLKLPDDATEEKFWDHGHDDCVIGFGLRVRESGVRTWIFQYKYGEKHERMKIGTWPSLSLEKARAKARKHRHEVDDGGNPAAKRVEAKKRAADSFRPVAERFLGWQAKRLKPRYYEEVERHLTKHAKPLQDKLLAGIDRRAIAALLSEISADRGPMAGNRLRASLSAFFAWAMREGLIEQNPVIGTNRHDETKRDRVLSDAELREIWNALLPDDYGDVVRLLLLTGQRREEIGGLRWDEIDFDHGVITLPPARTKNKREHKIPMSDAVTSILQARRGLVDREFVFGRGSGGYQGWSNSKESLEARIRDARGKKAKAVPRWTLHDLRRTCATQMADKLGVLPHVVEATLNHISGHKSGVAGTYNRANYVVERRHALNMWADYVQSIVAGGTPTVVPLRKEVPA
jgi:integrase